MLPLSGLKILSIEQFGAGPFGSLHLSNLGAEVVKIENPRAPDVARDQGPYFAEDGEPSSSSLYFQALNFNKKSVTLDLASSEGREVFLRLVAKADAVFHNMRGDVPKKLGISYKELAPANPKIVCVHLTAYGRDNERTAWPGYDYIMQAQAGYCSLTGEPDSPPTRFGLSIVDWMTGLTAALGLVSGVMGARQSGVGGDMDVNLYDVALYNLNYVGIWELNTDHKQGKVLRGGHPAGSPAQMFKTADGWMYIMAGTKAYHWETLCKIIDRPNLIVDPRFNSVGGRAQNRAELSDIIDEALSARTTAEWMELLGSKVPAGPVLSVSDALSDAHALKTGAIDDVALPLGAHMKAIRNPLRWNGGTRPLNGAPALGEHTDEVLTHAGLSGVEISEMRAQGVI